MIDGKNIQALEILAATGHQKDEEIDVFMTALALGAVHDPDITLQPYVDHMDDMIQELRMMGEKKTLQDRIEAINTILFFDHDYTPTIDSFDNLDNANLLHVIENRAGLPVAISILYMHLAQSQGWDIEGLNFPGHFIVRMSMEGEREIIDPYMQGKVLNAADLRKIVKQTMGDSAELSSTYYDGVTRRDVLFRLQNNIKIRLIRDDKYKQAAEQVDIMRLFAPNEPRLLYDAGLLQFKLKNYELAVAYLGQYYDGLPSGAEKNEVGQIIAEIRSLY